MKKKFKLWGKKKNVVKAVGQVAEIVKVLAEVDSIEVKINRK